MKIRAAVLEEFAKPLAVQDVELDGPGQGEVLVRLAACGVCHTDLYTASGADPYGDHVLSAPGPAQARKRPSVCCAGPATAPERSSSAISSGE